MKLEKIKRNFVSYMEEVHGGNPYPRNFIGCLMAISVESEPVSQERIMELTGYNQATVSLAIQKLQLLLSLRSVKKKGDRRNYYVYADAAYTFVLDLLQKRVDVQDIDTKVIDSLLEKVRESNDGIELAQFETYLENMNLYLKLIHEIRSANVEPYKQALATGSLDGLNLDGIEFWKKKNVVDFIAKLKEIRTTTDDSSTDSSQFIPLKNEYFTGLKTNLNPLFSQAIANQFVVIHSVLLEGRTTQDQLETTTLLPRSTISEVLKHSVERGIIEVSGSRPKYYRPVISFSDLMLAGFDRAANYMSTMITKLSEFANTTRKVRPKSKEATEFLNFLIRLDEAYSLAYAFSIDMKVKTVRRLMKEFNQGFEFI